MFNAAYSIQVLAVNPKFHIRQATGDCFQVFLQDQSEQKNTYNNETNL